MSDVYYNENDPKAVRWLKELIRDGLIPDGDVDERSIKDVQPSGLIRYRQCHFLSGIGGWAYALSLANWPKENRSGPGVARASRSPQQESLREFAMRDTCGLIFDGPSKSAGLQQSLENRLRARMGATGSPEYALIWKHWDMPSGEPICALRASGHRTQGKGSTGWPTPRAEDSEQTGSHRGNLDTLNSASKASGWPTPRSNESNESNETQKLREARGVKASKNLDSTAQLMSGWPTPRSNDSTGEKIPPGREGGVALKTAVVAAGWQTPTSTLPQRSSLDAHEKRRQYRESIGRNSLAPGNLGEQVALYTGWSTPTTRDHKDGTEKSCENVPVNKLLGREVHASGTPPSGTNVSTERPEGFRLNPHFSLWLMGYPDEWESCGERAMQSSRKSPPHS